MKLRLFVQTLSAMAIALSATANITHPSYAQSKKFDCGMSSNGPATLVRTSRGNIPIIRWVNNAFPPPWTPQQRCEEISARFQRFYNNGTLKFLRGGRLRGQPVLCVASYKGGPCLPNGVLVTLKPGTDPQLTLARLSDFRAGGSGRPIQLSGSRNTGAEVSYVNDAAYLDVEKLITEAEGSETSTSCPPGRPIWECE